MSPSLTLEIARVRFVVEPPAGLRVVLDDPRYGPFLQERAKSPGLIEVPVELVLDEGPSMAHLPVEFESEGPWRAFKEQEDLLFEFRDSAGQRVWLVRVSPAVARARIHCGPFAARVVGEGPHHLPSPLHYPLDQILTMCLLPRHSGLLIHAAGVRSGETAVVFPGHSGAGKSTLMGLLAGSAELSGLSDDRIAIRDIDDAFCAFGTPWAGTGLVASSDSASLGAIAFLHQAQETRLERIGVQAALGQLLRTASIPWFDADGMTRALAVCERLLTRVPTYDLHFRRHPEVREALAALF